MKLSAPKEIWILSIAFLVIFFGFDAVQSFITVFFKEANALEVGFRSLILIYLFFILSNPLAAVLVSKYGAKKCMILASIFYSLFIFSLLSKSTILIYLASAFVGISASSLWTGQNTYLIRASEENTRGANSGLFSSLKTLGSALGAIAIGFLITRFSFGFPFLVFAFFPLIGFLLLFKLVDLRTEQRGVNRFKLVKKSITSPTGLQISTIWFSWSFIYGLVIGIVPIQIRGVLGGSSYAL